MQLAMMGCRTVLNSQSIFFCSSLLILPRLALFLLHDLNVERKRKKRRNARELVEF
jgi:hypothetical protein